MDLHAVGRLRLGSVKITSQGLSQLSLRLLSCAQDCISWSSEDLDVSLLAGTIRCVVCEFAEEVTRSDRFEVSSTDNIGSGSNS